MGSEISNFRTLDDIFTTTPKMAKDQMVLLEPGVIGNLERDVA